MKVVTERLGQRAIEPGISNAGAARCVFILESRYAKYIAGQREYDFDRPAHIARVLETRPNDLSGFAAAPGADERAKLIAGLNSVARTPPDNGPGLVAVQLAALAARHKTPPFSGRLRGDQPGTKRTRCAMLPVANFTTASGVEPLALSQVRGEGEARPSVMIRLNCMASTASIRIMLACLHPAVSTVRSRR